MGDTELLAVPPVPLRDTLEQCGPKKRGMPEQASEQQKRVKRE